MACLSFAVVFSLCSVGEKFRVHTNGVATLLGNGIDKTGRIFLFHPGRWFFRGESGAAPLVLSLRGYELLFLLLCMPRLASAFGGSRKEKGEGKVSLYICI